MGLETAIALVGLAAAGAGAGYSINASNEAQAEMEKRVNEQLAQQKDLQKKGKGLLEKNVEASTPQSAQQAIDTGAQKAQGLYRDIAQVPLSQSQGSVLGAQNVAVGDQTGKEYQQLLGNAASALQGQRDWQVSKGIGNTLTNAQLGSLNFLSQMDASTLPYLLQAAQNQGAQGQAIGSLLGSLGSLGAVYGASKGGLGLGKTYPTSQGTYGLNYGMDVPGGLSLQP